MQKGLKNYTLSKYIWIYIFWFTYPVFIAVLIAATKDILSFSRISFQFIKQNIFFKKKNTTHEDQIDGHKVVFSFYEPNI